MLGLFVCLFVFPDRVSLCSLGCPGTHSVDQAGLQFRNLPASASEVLGLMACTALLYYLNPPARGSGGGGGGGRVGGGGWGGGGVG